MEIDGTDLAAFALVERLDLLVSDAPFVIHYHLDGTTGLGGISLIGFHECLDAVDLGSGACLMVAQLALWEMTPAQMMWMPLPQPVCMS